MIGVRKARALRDEALAREYMTVDQVRQQLGVSATTVRNLVNDGLLPATDLTPGSKIRTLRIRADDFLTLDARLRAYARAKERGEGESYLEGLRERWERREEEEVEAIVAGDA